MNSEVFERNENTSATQGEKKAYTIEEDWILLMHLVLQDALGKAKAMLPQEGVFPKIKVGLIYPGDEETHGLLNLEPGSDKKRRVAHVGAYRHGTDRLVSNFFFFDSTQALVDWLAAEDTGPKLIEIYQHLREKVE